MQRKAGRGIGGDGLVLWFGTNVPWSDPDVVDVHHDDPEFGYRFITDELASQGFTASRNGGRQLIWRPVLSRGQVRVASRRCIGAGQRWYGPVGSRVGGGVVARRAVRLISAGWLPHDRYPSGALCESRVEPRPAPPRGVSPAPRRRRRCGRAAHFVSPVAPRAACPAGDPPVSVGGPVRLLCWVGGRVVCRRGRPGSSTGRRARGRPRRPRSWAACPGGRAVTSAGAAAGSRRGPGADAGGGQEPADRLGHRRRRDRGLQPGSGSGHEAALPA